MKEKQWFLVKICKQEKYLKFNVYLCGAIGEKHPQKANEFLKKSDKSVNKWCTMTL
jgi:hypothetical protein